MKSSKFQISSSKFQVPSSKGKRGRFAFLDKISSDSMFGGFEMHDGAVSGCGGDRPYDLEERTELFGERIVRFSKKIPRGPGNDRLIGQVVGAGTSVGANYAEASESVSQKDFKYAISRCVKEAKETRFFLRMIVAAEPNLAEEARKLYREARELHLIFASMYRK